MGWSLRCVNSERRVCRLKLVETSIFGAWILDIEPVEDARGFFARTLCANMLEQHGLESKILQQSVSFNRSRGILRGLHYQSKPYEEVKMVRVTKGRIYDVILDLRCDSPSYLRWDAIELSADNHRTVYIPKGVAHGFQVLDNNSEVFYQMTESYVPSHACGVRWNDPVFSIDWPLSDPVLSERDACYPDFILN